MTGGEGISPSDSDEAADPPAVAPLHTLDLPALIATLRPDLRKAFGKKLLGSHDDFLRWLIWFGCKEYPALREDDRLAKLLHSVEEGRAPGGGNVTKLQTWIRRARPDVRKAFPLPRKEKQFQQWFFTHGIVEHDLFEMLPPEQQRVALNQVEPWRTKIQELQNRKSARLATIDVPEPDALPFGVNLIGYAFGELGIGEDLRMAARSLQSAGIPVAVVNFSPGKEIRQQDFSIQELVRDSGPYAINLFCLTALEHGRYYAERGAAQMRSRFNIGFWPWELAKWPTEWNQMVFLADEIWVSSNHTRAAVEPVAGSVPIHRMPMAVEIGEVSRRGRSSFQLPEDRILFCFAFDLSSSIHRKNPDACLRAFLRAFPQHEAMVDPGSLAGRAGLVIKTHKPAKPDKNWDRLKNIAEQDGRIHIVEETLPRPDLLALFACCDCFLSLHRAEGYGRGLAEALQLGLHLICTDYSGNTDFCRPPHVSPVQYELVRVRKGQYPFSKGAVWAKADVSHAAHLMREFAADRLSATAENPFDGSLFSPASVGAIYRERLERLWKDPARLEIARSRYPRWRSIGE